MTCAEFLADVDAYALGALERAERAAADAHLSSAGPHEGCIEALRRAEATCVELAHSLPPERADERLWQSIAASTGQARPAVRARERILWAGALAACLLVAAFFGARSSAERESRARADALLALFSDPSSVVVPLAPQAGAGERARAVLDLARRRAVLLASSLAQRPGRDYELWVIRGDKKLPAGLLRASGGEAVTSIDARLLDAPVDALAVSIEPEGGSPQPTGPIVLVGVVPKA